jgi:hypothetical protein
VPLGIFGLYEPPESTNSGLKPPVYQFCQESRHDPFGSALKPVVTLRPVRGNLATKHDRSPAQLEKTLRRQFGSFYDQKKIGNI